MAYPPYSLTITGIGLDRVMTGTHDGALVTSNPKMTIKFELTHDAANPPVQGQAPPNLILTLTEVIEAAPEAAAEVVPEVAPKE